MRRVLSLFVIVVAVAAVAAAQQPVDERVPAASNGTVEIENLAGSVTVTGWGQDEVWVSGTLGRGAERCEVSGSGGHTLIRVHLPDHAKDIKGTHLEVRIPAASTLEVETVSADIEVADLEGRIDLESVSGQVTVDATPDTLEVATVSGGITIAAAPPGTDAESVSGDIEIQEARDELEAETVSGSVRVLGGALENAELSTTSGSVRCEADLFGRGTIELESMSGTVVLVVPAGIGADFEIETFSGQIVNEIGPEPERKNRHIPGKELKFSTGSGGPRVRLSSFSGSVRLLTR